MIVDLKFNPPIRRPATEAKLLSAYFSATVISVSPDVLVYFGIEPPVEGVAVKSIGCEPLAEFLLTAFPEETRDNLVDLKAAGVHIENLVLQPRFYFEGQWATGVELRMTEVRQPCVVH